jgi:hypothetical protein
MAMSADLQGHATHADLPQLEKLIDPGVEAAALSARAVPL